MNRTAIKEIIKATGGILIRGSEEDFITGVRHDSRECASGDMFVAIAGKNQDGHKYIPQVAEAGCRTVLVSHEDMWPDEVRNTELNIIRVDDTVYAMGELAKYYLDTLDVIKVAVTGSVGKTSVRDMIYYVLSEKYNCGRNLKNFNNNIGLPISIFQFDNSTEAVVLEMGMDDFGEIDRLAEMVKPNIAVITNIGMAHIEKLGSRDGIFKAKMEITKHITEYNGEPGALVFPQDDEFLTRERTAGQYRQITIGENGESMYIISAVDDFGLEGIEFTLERKGESRRFRIPVAGRHNAVNGAVAIAVGDLVSIDMEEAAEGLSKAELTGSRLRSLKSKKLTVIDDTYNANPDSMKSAMRVLERSRCDGKKIAVMGDMFELGHESKRQHFGVGLFARNLKIDILITVGKEARYIAEGAAGGAVEVTHYENKEAFYKEMSRFADFGDIILVKGSRGMMMEQVVEKLLEL